MVKADPKRNYYADLEIPHNASTEDIKKQFRKLARLYHPDRNQGKEDEFVPKFQAIQAAHEILSDPNERAKYDADRKRLGYLAKPVRPPFATAHTASARAAPPRPASFYQRDQFAQKPNQSPHPPKPPPRPSPAAQAPPPPNHTKPSWYGSTAHSPQSPYTSTHPRPSPSTTGPSRFSNFHPPPSARASNKDDPHLRANAFSAWQSMQNRGTRTNPGTGPTTPAASTPGSEDERRANQEGPFGRSAASGPGMRRSNTTKHPRRAGFDPNQPGDSWEPPATRTSSYTTRHSFAAQGGQTPAHSNESDSSTQAAQSSGHGLRQRHSHHDLRPTASAPDQPLFGERHSAPYRAPGGEKLNLNNDHNQQSNGARDSPRPGARFDTSNFTSTTKSNSPRSQSVNVRQSSSSRRGSKQPHVIDLTDSSDSPPPRPMAKPSRRWASPSKTTQSTDATQARKHNSDPERRPSINTEFSSSEDFRGFQGSNGLNPPPSATHNLRRTSPMRRAQGPVDTSKLPDPFKSIFPQHPSAQPVKPKENTNTPPVKFDQDAWSKTFKEPSFFIPNPATMGTQTSRPPSTARKQTRPRAMSKSEEQLRSASTEDSASPLGQPEAPLAENATVQDDVDAMDIDLEAGPPVNEPAIDKTARNVNMPPHRTNWQTINEPGATPDHPSTVHISPAPFLSVPTAVPNAMPPPPPPPPMSDQMSPRSPLSPRSTSKPPAVHPRAESTSPSLNLADLGQNLTSRRASGVADLGDLSATLPFESRASEKNPKAPSTGPLNIPRPPNGPMVPTSKRLTSVQWKQYVSEMSVYMGQWYQWDARIMQHLHTRHHDSAKFGTGVPSISATALLEAVGDVQAGGIERWEAELEQDRRVRDFWAAACNKHQKTVREFVAVKRRVAVDGLLLGQ